MCNRLVESRKLETLFQKMCICWLIITDYIIKCTVACDTIRYPSSFKDQGTKMG
jgi:hypothetical protein